MMSHSTFLVLHARECRGKVGGALRVEQDEFGNELAHGGLVRPEPLQRDLVVAIDEHADLSQAGLDA
jgi:hypothetical protein